MQIAATSPTIPRFAASHPLGHLRALRRDFLDFQRRAAATGDVVRARLGVLDTVWVSSPSALHEVLQARAEDYEKSPSLTRMLRPVIGDGILSSQGSRHRRRRGIVAPAFQSGRIARYADAIVALTDATLHDFERRDEVDVAEEMMRLTLEIVADTLFHTDVDADVRAVGRAVTAGSQAFARMLRSPLPLPPSPLTGAGRQLLHAARDLDDVVYRIIAERRASGEDPGDVLSMLLGARDAESQEPLSDVELRDEVMTLFLAGHETTANGLTWALQLLALHPEVAARLQREVDDVLGDRAPAHADLPRLPYALAVFKEAMRLFPPAFVVGRKALTETRIGRYRIPRGQVVFGNIYGVHHRADVFERPESFEPERFVDGAEKRWPKGAYIPFSIGPRVCVGNHFALMEGQLVLARLAQRLELAGQIHALAPTQPQVTLRPMTAVPMRIRMRRPTSVPAQASRSRAQTG